MQRHHLLFLVLFPCFTLMGFDTYRLHYLTGPDAGLSNDPAGNFQTCNGCHVGSELVALDSIITSDVPAMGYVPNATYTFSIAIKRNNALRYGFQVSPQNAQGTYLGELKIIDTNTYLNTSDERYINHSYNGYNFPDGVGRWNFQWVAPPASSGEVTFYGAFLIANGDKKAMGDQVVTSTLTVKEAVLTHVGTEINDKAALQLDVYPNPAGQNLDITLHRKTSGAATGSIVAADGTEIDTFPIKTTDLADYHKTMRIGHLKSGVYRLQIISGKEKISKSFVVK